jgi:hypothetical protein
MRRLAVVMLFAAACSAPPSFTGTYSGKIITQLDPEPDGGSPTFNATVTLAQSSGSITGSWTATSDYAGQTTNSSGTLAGSASDVTLKPLTLTIDHFASTCDSAPLSAKGDGSLATDALPPKLTWSASADTTCQGRATHVYMVAPAGMKRCAGDAGC